MLRVDVLEVAFNVTSLDTITSDELTQLSEYFAASLAVPSEHIQVQIDSNRRLLLVGILAPGEFPDWQAQGSAFYSYKLDELRLALAARLGTTVATTQQWLNAAMPPGHTLLQMPEYADLDKCFDLYEAVRAVAFQSQVLSSGFLSAILVISVCAICIPGALVALYFARGRFAFRAANPVVIPPPPIDRGYATEIADSAAATTISDRLARARNSRVMYEI